MLLFRENKIYLILIPKRNIWKKILGYNNKYSIYFYRPVKLLQKTVFTGYLLGFGINLMNGTF